MRPGREGKGYALWLMPSGPTCRQLCRAIQALSRRQASPPFEPHITLLGGIGLPEPEAKSRAAALAARLTAFDIHLGEIGFSDEYFRCLFLRVQNPEVLIPAHEIARQIFGVSARQPYVPHLSLMYGTLPVDIQRRIASRRFPRVCFHTSRVYLYSVEGPPSGWRAVAVINVV